MKITFREIVEALKIKGPIYLTPPELIDKNNYVFYKTISKAEEMSIDNGTHDVKIDYGNEDIGIHLPDIDIEQFWQLENNRNPFAAECVIERINQMMPICLCEIPTIFAIYCVLHEYGHWIYFLKTKQTPYEYSKNEYNTRQDSEKVAKDIYNIPDWHPIKSKLAREYYNKKYSKIPSEEFANNYADKHILKAIKKVRKFLGYSEEDLIKMTLS